MKNVDENIEEWRPVVGAPIALEVSSLGRVRRMAFIDAGGNARQTTFISTRHRGGYLHINVSLGKIRFRSAISRLVLEAFVGPRPEGMEACHSPDRDPSNNRVSNLRWDTPLENAWDKLRHGTACRGEDHGLSKLKESDVESIRERLKAGASARSLAKIHGVSVRNIYYIKNRAGWMHL